ncbi:MAG: glycoside hydrolase family 9 protein, partial [Deltaproteobacteria bacterium]|nr:glycoside hydrolase family 9 protein [Deltaproteobacteria bacterium]
GSPPSAATGQSLYGTASTSATLSTAAAFALGAKVLGGVSGLGAYASDLETRAIQAYAWADANPAVLFYNNDGNSGTQGLGAGQQETDDYGRQTTKIEAAVYLFALTDQASYRSHVDQNYAAVHLIDWSYAYPFEGDQQSMLLYYAALPGATATVADDIRSTYLSAMAGTDNFAALDGDVDPYFAHLADYTWGSNSTKSHQGSMYLDLVAYAVSGADAAAARAAAERYVHYLHGVNPLGLVYLSNMGSLGAEKSVTQFYHAWFTHGSELWDSTDESTYGPAPGFLTGGPNPSYGIDGCCPASCGSTENNAVCSSESLEPPLNQPEQKSYKDFNTSWPLNSWEVTENSNGYQVAYIRLLSKMVP